MILPAYLTESETINLCTDASKAGFGGTFGSSWVQGKYPPAWQELNIAVLELFPIYLLISIFGHKLRNSHVTFLCDNQAVTVIINKQTSKDPTIMSILRPLVLLLLQHNIYFRATHLPGRLNELCDKISRNQVSKELLQQYGMMPSPTPIPEALQPGNFVL